MPSINSCTLQWNLVFHRICGKLFSTIDELMESFLQTLWNSVFHKIRGKNIIHVELGLPFVDEFTLRKSQKGLEWVFFSKTPSNHFLEFYECP